MLKESLADVLPEHIWALLDSEYQGANEYLPNVLVPFKSAKKNPLTVEQKVFNTMLSKLRVAIEHINRELKIFKLFKETCHGKGKRGLLRIRVVASIYNHRVVF